MISLRCESKKHSKNKIKTQQTREYNKKESDSYREQTTFYGTGGNMGLGGGEWEAAQAALGGSVQGAGCWGLGAGCLVQGARGFGAGCWWLSAECWGLSAGCWGLSAGCWVTQCRVLGGSVQGAGGLGAECWWKGMSEEALRGAWHSQASTLHGKCAAAYPLPRADRLLEKPLFSGSHVPQGNCVPGLTPGCTNLCGF